MTSLVDVREPDSQQPAGAFSLSVNHSTGVCVVSVITLKKKINMSGDYVKNYVYSIDNIR